MKIKMVNLEVEGSKIDNLSILRVGNIFNINVSKSHIVNLDVSLLGKISNLNVIGQ